MSPRGFVSVWRRSCTAGLLALAVLLLGPTGSKAAESSTPSTNYLIDVWRSDEGLPRDGIVSLAQGADGYLWVCSVYALARFDGARFVNFDPAGASIFQGGLVLGLMADRFGTVWMGTARGGLLQWRDGRLWRCLPERAASGPPFSFPTEVPGQGTALSPDGRLLRWTNGRVESEVNATRWGEPIRTSICQDSKGTVWFLTDQARVARVNGTNAQEVVAALRGGASALDASKWTALQLDAAGRLWAGTEQGLAVWEGDGFEAVNTPQWPFAVRDIVATSNRHDEEGRETVGGSDASTRSAGLWVFANDHLWLRQGERWAAQVPFELAPGVAVTARLTDKKGNLWFSTSDNTGLIRADADGTLLVLTAKDGLPSGRITSLCEDREGSVWVGLKRIGLARLRERRFTVFGTREGLSAPVVWAVLEDSAGSMWFGTEGGGVNRLQRGAFTQFGVGKGGSAGDVRSLFLDRRGTLWSGTADNGVFWFTNGKFIQALDPQQIGENNKVFVIYEDRAGHFWLGTDLGLFRWHKGQLRRYEGKGFQMGVVRVITEDAAGGLWVGMWGDVVTRLARLEGDQFTAHGVEEGLARSGGVQFTAYGVEDSLVDQHVFGLHADRDGAVWIGTIGGGLWRWRDGRCTRYTTKKGLPDNRIGSISQDERGDLWLGSPGGIFRLNLASVAALDSGRTNRLECLTFDRADGLPTRECTAGSQPSIWRARDGRIWFAMFQGAVALRPDEVRINTLPPRVLIEEVFVDRVKAWDRPSVSPHATHPGALRIRPGRHLMEFRYTATSLTAPAKVRFKYQLEGLDTDWREAGASRAAIYNVTAPGHYRFRVTACNNDGVWNETGVALALIVAPYLWQTWWFKVTALLALLVTVGGTIRFFERRKLQRKLERLEMQQAVERERTRIARDIHDDVGASLTEIALLSEFAQIDSAPAEQVKADVQKIAVKARGSTQALDEIVWAVNPRNDTLDGFVNYACTYAEEQLRLAGIRCRLDVPATLPSCPLRAVVRHHLFLAFKEALNNVVKHAAASEVQIRISVEPKRFAVVVADNGGGFVLERQSVRNEKPEPPYDPHPPALGRSDAPTLLRGNGLANMKERLEDIGGAFECESAPGNGTRVKLSVSWA